MAEKFREINVRCLIYTSPSHTIAAPRLRVLLPVSRKLALEMRAKLCARVNGRLGGIFARESFTLSQGYYYGAALDNQAPDHRAEIIDGRFVDLCDDLNRFEKHGWPRNDVKRDKPKADDGLNIWQRLGMKYGARDDDGPDGFDEHIALIGDGEGLNGFNDPLTRSAAAYVTENGADFDRKELKQLLREAIQAAPKKKTRKAADIARYSSNRYLNDIIPAQSGSSGISAQIQELMQVTASRQHCRRSQRPPSSGSNLRKFHRASGCIVRTTSGNSPH
jgi:hypothetical protein